MEIHYDGYFLGMLVPGYLTSVANIYVAVPDFIFSECHLVKDLP